MNQTQLTQETSINLLLFIHSDSQLFPVYYLIAIYFKRYIESLATLLSSNFSNILLHFLS